MKRSWIPLFAAAVLGCLSVSSAVRAQPPEVANCATATPCATSGNPHDTHTGDDLPVSFGKFNQDFTQVFSTSFLAVPSVFSVTAVNGTGLSLGFAGGQPANEFLATVSGSSGPLNLRAIVSADLPPINLASTSDGGVTGVLPNTSVAPINLASTSNGGVTGILGLAQGGIAATSFQGAGLGIFISGTTTSTLLLANHPASGCNGCSAVTSDMGPMTSDGINWKVTGIPPIPPGAAMLGYTTHVYTKFPSQSEIVLARGTSKADLYAGLSFNSTQPIAGSFGTDATTGQLELFYNQSSNPSNPAQLTTVTSQNTASLTVALGNIPPAIASKGFSFVAAYTIPTDNSDSFDAFYLLPWQHNSSQTANEPGGSFPSCIIQYAEYDISENGHGTDQGGFERGAYVNWTGGASGCAETLTAAPSGTLTSLTMTTNWAGDTASHYSITIGGSGQVISNATLTNGSPTISFSSTAITGGATTALSVGLSNTVINNSHTSSFSYTTEHIFEGDYDPVGQKFYVWVDGALQDTLSTSVAGTTNTFRDSLGYEAIIQMASHGANTAGTMLLRYFQLWTGGGTGASAGSGAVSSFSGDGALLSNSGSTGAVTTTLENTGVGYGVWGNVGSSSGAPSYNAMSSYPGSAFPTVAAATSASELNGGTVPASAALIGTNSSSQPVAVSLAGGLQVVSGVLEPSQQINAQTGTTYAIASTDAGKLITRANASSCADTIVAATTTGFTAGFSFDYQNKGSASCTLTATTSTINGSSSAFSLPANTGCTFSSDGTNYQVSACSALVAGSLSAIPSQNLLGNGGGSTAVPTATPIAGNLAFNAAGALTTSQAIEIKTGAYTIASTDAGALIEFNSGSAAPWTLPQAGTSGFAAGFSFDVYNLNVGLLTITPTTSTVNGQTSLTLMYGDSCTITADGSGNYDVSACTATIHQGTFLGVASGTGACASTGSVSAVTYLGQFACTGTTGASTVTITLPSALHGYHCNGSDTTTGHYAVLYQEGNSTSSCTLGAASVTSGDILTFKADGY